MEHGKPSAGFNGVPRGAWLSGQDMAGSTPLPMWYSSGAVIPHIRIRVVFSDGSTPRAIREDQLDGLISAPAGELTICHHSHAVVYM